MGQPPGRPRSMNGFEMVTKSKVKITNASNKVNSSQYLPLMYLGGNHLNHNGKHGLRRGKAAVATGPHTQVLPTHLSATDWLIYSVKCRAGMRWNIWRLPLILFNLSR